MMKRTTSNLFIAAALTLLSSLACAKTGYLFKIAQSGAAASADVVLCLNGKGPLSCQNYHVSGEILAINAIPNHAYPIAGIKVLTPGYKATECTPYPNGFCLFSANSQKPVTIILNGGNVANSDYRVSGTTSGLVGSVSLQNNGRDTLSQGSNGNFTFATPVAQGASYNVTVSSQPATQTCTVSNGTGTVGNANVTNIQVTCSTNSHTVGGTTSGLVGSVSLQDNGGDTLVQGSDGNFTFATPVAQGANYNVTVSSQPATQTCTVNNGTGTVGNVNVTNIQVTCSTNSHTVGGTTSGLVGSVSLQDNGGDTLTQSSDGNFTFATPVAQGANYNVTVSSQPATQTCTVNNGTGTIGDTNVTNIQVVCSTNDYTVGGTISGLTGSVSLQDNGGDTLTQDSNGNFTFATPVAEGANYNVTVSSQPATQTCTVSNGTGTIGNSNVTNVGVECANNTTTLSVTANGVIPVNNGSGSVIITNTGTTNPATNVSITLPSGWTGVTEDASNCTSIAPNNGTCIITFTTTTPYVAQGNIAVTGDNISNTPTTALASSVNGYLVWEVTNDTTVQVIDSVDLATPSQGITWGGAGTEIGAGAQSYTDGAANTAAIVATLGTSSSYAAELCNQSTNGNASVGNWYLPAMCQMVGPNGNVHCTSGLASIDVNLLQLGFVNLKNLYWSSTEYAIQNPQDNAWYKNFEYQGNTDAEGNDGKTALLGVHCARALTY